MGAGPRTGTTLMMELMAACFDVARAPAHETSIFDRPEPGTGIFCSKHPGELRAMPLVLRIDPDLWVIHMVRDPRDVVVSRHAKAPDRYWTTLRGWRLGRRAARALARHPRALTVRYEELVREPARIQARIQRWMPLLTRRAAFADYHRVAAPPAAAREALGEVRPLSQSSIGAWRRHKPRLVAQLALHGPIDAELRALGYEADDRWKAELAGVVPDNGLGYWPDRITRVDAIRRAVRRYLAIGRYSVARLVSLW